MRTAIIVSALLVAGCSQQPPQIAGRSQRTTQPHAAQRLEKIQGHLRRASVVMLEGRKALMSDDITKQESVRRAASAIDALVATMTELRVIGIEDYPEAEEYVAACTNMLRIHHDMQLGWIAIDELSKRGPAARAAKNPGAPLSVLEEAIEEHKSAEAAMRKIMADNDQRMEQLQGHSVKIRFVRDRLAARVGDDCLVPPDWYKS